MALQLNTYARTTANITSWHTRGTLFAASGTARTILVYPTTVSYPISPVNNYQALPTGHMLSLTGQGMTTSGTSIIFSSVPSMSALLSGTASWFAVYSTTGSTSSAGLVMISDSVGISGSSSILTLSSLTMTSGQTITASFALTFT